MFLVVVCLRLGIIDKEKKSYLAEKRKIRVRISVPYNAINRYFFCYSIYVGPSIFKNLILIRASIEVTCTPST